MYTTWSVSPCLLRPCGQKLKSCLHSERCVCYLQKYVSASSKSRRDQVRSTANLVSWRNSTLLVAQLWSLWPASWNSAAALTLSTSVSWNPHGLSHSPVYVSYAMSCWLVTATFQLAQVFYLSGVCCLSHGGNCPHQHLEKRTGPTEKLVRVITRPQWGSCMKFPRNYWKEEQNNGQKNSNENMYSTHANESSLRKRECSGIEW